ncbi:DNA gyrase subunit A [Streptomyces badius]
MADENTPVTPESVTPEEEGTIPGVGMRVEPVQLETEMQRSYLDYAMSVIVSRALPDVRDGLKPVHRRVLYAMYDGGYRPEKGFYKCARVVGDVMGTYHPHGDSSIYDALVRLAQSWSMRMPLVDSNGNFGSPGNDPAAAMRYTECKMMPLSMEMVRDIDEETVDFQDTTTAATRSRRSCRRASRTCWSTAPPGSRSVWRPTSRRTTSVRSPPVPSGTWRTRRPRTRSCRTR